MAAEDRSSRELFQAVDDAGLIVRVPIKSDAVVDPKTCHIITDDGGSEVAETKLHRSWGVDVEFESPVDVEFESDGGLFGVAAAAVLCTAPATA
ncbi:hypothetical protein R1sor_023186 [Riccia sorocarpa]|uniref:Uncharacterized protein n=1 Tax=Riccia sorocarpa TaxID=122646 RepID=A0ABD3GQA2_9MARC